MSFLGSTGLSPVIVRHDGQERVFGQTLDRLPPFQVKARAGIEAYLKHERDARATKERTIR